MKTKTKCKMKKDCVGNIKMGQEFNLSEKIGLAGEMYSAGHMLGIIGGRDIDVIRIEDVKEFIRLLKEKIRINGNLSYRIIKTEDEEFENKHDFVLNNIVLEIIDKLAGDKLTNETENF